MRNTLETRIGIFVALVVLAAVFILDIVGSDIFTRGYRLYGLFGTVNELKVGDRVKMAGVEIGRVEDIHLTTNNTVMVIMKVRRTAHVRTDSVATIKFSGLLGQNFVSMTFGTPGAELANNGTHLTTEPQPDLSSLMAKLNNVATGVENLTKSFTGFKVSDLLGPLTDFIQASQVPLTESISNMQSISTEIAQGKGTVGKLIYTDALYNSALGAVTNLQDTADQIKVTVADARKILEEINAGQGTAGRLVKDDTLYKETTASMTNLKEILQKINNGQGTVGKLVNDQEFYKNAKLSLQKIDKATEGLEDQGPLSVLGIAVNSLL